jgi:ribosomal protein S18 acetylase RimI-like enzyme
MNVRRAEPTEADVTLVAPLFDAYWQYYGIAPDPKRAREFIAEHLHHRESVIFLALDTDGGADRALGFVQLYPSFSSVAARRLWVLNDLFVAPGGRGKGVGRALMDRARRHGEETGACRLTLETMSDNEAAKALYRSLGYVRDPHAVEHHTFELT